MGRSSIKGRLQEKMNLTADDKSKPLHSLKFYRFSQLRETVPTPRGGFYQQFARGERCNSRCVRAASGADGWMFPKN